MSRALPLRALLGVVLFIGMPCVRAAGAAAMPWTLERAILLQRHGVRAPTDEPAALARYSAESWPQWPVPPGNLTPGGRRALAVMASFVRARYTGLGLLPDTACTAPGAIYVWADGADERTRASGATMAAGLAPGCSLVSHYAESKRDPLFHSVEARSCRVRAQAAQAAIMKRVSGNLDALGPQYEQARLALQALLWPGVRDCGGADVRCFMVRGHNRLTVAHNELKLAGPLKLGSTLSEDLLLEYIDGLPDGKVGWGRAASPERLRQLLPLHVLYARLMRRTRELASAGGTPLAQLMLLLLEGQSIAGPWPGSQVPNSARLIILAGHDTNLSNVGSILGLDWTLPGEPDSTAPDTTLALELWRDGQGRRYVSALVLYQTLSELRTEAMGAKAGGDGSPARVYPLIFPGCTGLRCPLGIVRTRIESQTDPDCTRPDPAIRVRPAGAH